jgi:membrane-bound serine protease (ClpP class)
VALLGVLAIYAEFIRPGRIMPGVLGAAALVWGCYSLWQHQPSGAGILWIVVAAALFVAESLWNTYFFAGALGTACLALGASKLFDRGPGIEVAIAIPASVVFGTVTTFLGAAAKRARQNKWSDLKNR